MEEKRTNTYNIGEDCIQWLAQEAKRLDTSASKLLHKLIKDKMNKKK